MDNNNWYNPSGSYTSDGGYGCSNNKNGGKRGGVTIAQLVICLLVVALLSGAAGAYLNSSMGGGNAEPDKGSMIIEKPDEEAEPGRKPDERPSDRLIMGDGGKASAPDAVVQRCMAGVVGIDMGATTTSFATGKTQEQVIGSGSGVIISEDGYIVTNNHVISGGDSITVYLQDGTKYEAELIGTDTYTDLAVIKVKASGLPAAVLGRSGGVTVGDTVYAVGNPLGVLTGSVSRGIISGLDRTITIDGISMTLMQTDAAVNPGNSGGGLFNGSGELIGIVNAKNAGINVEGLGFAIPVDSAKPIITDLIDKGFVTGRPYIGITMQDVSLRYGGGNEGHGFSPFDFFNYSYVTRVQIMSVEKGSAAEKAGILANDIVTALDGAEVTGSSQFTAMLYEYKVGDKVTITVLRGNKTKDLNVLLGERS